MTRHIRKFAVILSTLALMLVGPDAFAGMGGGTISYSPYAESIPTLSESMLLVLAFLFVVVAFRALRAYPGGKPLASILAVGVLALAASSGDRLIQGAQAFVGYYFDQPNGGVVPVYDSIEVPVLNSSGRTQRINSVTPNLNTQAVSTTSSPQCVTGLVLPSSNTCYVHFAPSPP